MDLEFNGCASSVSTNRGFKFSNSWARLNYAGSSSFVSNCFDDCLYGCQWKCKFILCLTYQVPWSGTRAGTKQGKGGKEEGRKERQGEGGETLKRTAQWVTSPIRCGSPAEFVPELRWMVFHRQSCMSGIPLARRTQNHRAMGQNVVSQFSERSLGML